MLVILYMLYVYAYVKYPFLCVQVPKKNLMCCFFPFISYADSSQLETFAGNLLALEIGDELLCLVNEAESRARETVYNAEEELEGVYTF